MASVITSARTSTASIFDMFGDTADAAAKLVRTASRSIDALDSKVDLMTHSVIADSKGRKGRVNDTTAKQLTLEALELEEEIFRIKNPGETFDFSGQYDILYAAIKADIEAT